MNNPYDPPATDSDAHDLLARPLTLRRHVLRNCVALVFCLVCYCVIDFFDVHHGPESVSWAEWVFIPVFFGSILIANRGLFPKETGVQAISSLHYPLPPSTEFTDTEAMQEIVFRPGSRSPI